MKGKYRKDFTGTCTFKQKGINNMRECGMLLPIASLPSKYGIGCFSKEAYKFVDQLKEAGQEDKYRAVLEEIPRVRKDFGEPPLVTPSSQIVGTQAVMNVLSGERYKMVPKESKKIMMGEFGKTVKPFNKEVQKKIIGDATPITCRPADLIPPQLPKFEKECAQWKQQDEDVLSYALFPAVAKDFFEYREAQQTKVDQKTADKANKAYPV